MQREVPSILQIFRKLLGLHISISLNELKMLIKNSKHDLIPFSIHCVICTPRCSFYRILTLLCLFPFSSAGFKAHSAEQEP